jgi:hypothetical protein
MKKLVPVLMVTLAAVTISAVYIWQELREVRQQTRELRANMTEPGSAMPAGPTTAASPAPASGEPQPLAPERSGAVAQSSPPAATPATTASPRKPDPLQVIAQQMLGTPEGQEMLRAQLRAMLPMQFPDIGKELGLTPAETEKLLDMLVKHQLSLTGDALNMLGDNGSQDPAAMQATQRKMQEQQRTNQTELAELLGNKMPKYEEYQRTLPLRQQVTRLQTALGTGNNALSDSQSRQLLAALAAEQAQIQLDRRNAPRVQQQAPPNPQAAIEMQLERAVEDSRRMVNAARSHLNPQQLDQYRQMLEQQQNLQRTMMRSMGNQPVPAAPGTN